MAFWNKKKGNSKLMHYFATKGIACEEVEGEKEKLTFSLAFKERDYMLHPYITIENNLVSMNVNVVQSSVKNYDLFKLNTFNLNSNFFKAFITEEGIVTLEYKFLDQNIENMLDLLLDALYQLEEEIDSL